MPSTSPFKIYPNTDLNVVDVLMQHEQQKLSANFESVSYFNALFLKQLLTAATHSLNHNATYARLRLAVKDG